MKYLREYPFMSIMGYTVSSEAELDMPYRYFLVWHISTYSNATSDILFIEHNSFLRC